MAKSTGWNKIYEKPDSYTYYDLEAPHTDIVKVSTYFTHEHVRSVLDVGCGTGRNLIPLAKAGFEMTGLDNAPNGISAARRKVKAANAKAKLIVGAFEDLPFASDSFDAVISVQTLNHGYKKDILRGLSEIERILKEDGVFFFTVPGRISKGKVRYCLVKTAKKIEANTYIPTIGEETGIPHHIFTQSLIRKYLNHFTIVSLWKDDKDYYCVLAKKTVRK